MQLSEFEKQKLARLGLVQYPYSGFPEDWFTRKGRRLPNSEVNEILKGKSPRETYLCQ